MFRRAMISRKALEARNTHVQAELVVFSQEGEK